MHGAWSVEKKKIYISHGLTQTNTDKIFLSLSVCSLVNMGPFLFPGGRLNFEIFLCF
jgi:hypothetical protein